MTPYSKMINEATESDHKDREQVLEFGQCLMNLKLCWVMHRSPKKMKSCARAMQLRVKQQYTYDILNKFTKQAFPDVFLNKIEKELEK